MIAVIGCGNPNRSDDGAGPEVIRILLRRPISREHGIRLLDAGTDGMGVLFAARGCDSVIIVDACRSGLEPGAIFEAPANQLTFASARSLNLHDFRWQDALLAGRQMFPAEFPADVTVFLIEAETIRFGFELSPAITAAVSKVAARVEELIRMRTDRKDVAA
jgi:hydrogenase maturation protease